MLVVLMPSVVLLSPVSQFESLSPPPLVQLRIPSWAIRPALSSLAIDIFLGVIFLGGLSFRFRSGLLESVANPLIVFCPLFPCRYISGVRTLGVRVAFSVLASTMSVLRFERLLVLVIRMSGSAMNVEASRMALAESDLIPIPNPGDTQEAPRSTQEAPRSTQETPRSNQSHPGRTQETPRKHPEDTQDFCLPLTNI